MKISETVLISYRAKASKTVDSLGNAIFRMRNSNQVCEKKFRKHSFGNFATFNLRQKNSFRKEIS